MVITNAICLVCDPAKKTKQSQSSSDSASVHTAAAVADEGENHIDTSIEEDDVADLASPKKATEVLHNGGVGKHWCVNVIPLGGWMSCVPQTKCTYILDSAIFIIIIIVRAIACISSVGDLASLSPTNLESSDKIKEQVGASPSSSSDKVISTCTINN